PMLNLKKQTHNIFLSSIFANKDYQSKRELIVDSKVIKQTRLKVYQRFEKAIAKSGYLSLRSIIESTYYYPRKYNMEPLRQSSVIETEIDKKR
ncbi:hypothetical protein C9J27_26215, partial [Photobacterium kishitanii]